MWIPRQGNPRVTLASQSLTISGTLRPRKVTEVFLLLVFTGLESKRYGNHAYRNRTALGWRPQQTSFWGTRTPPSTFMRSVPARAPGGDYHV
jgi:hypothetical protein